MYGTKLETGSSRWRLLGVLSALMGIHDPRILAQSRSTEEDVVAELKDIIKSTDNLATEVTAQFDA